MDEQVSNAVEKHLKHIGIEIILNANVEHVSHGEVILQLQSMNTKRILVANLVVVCTGRKPAISNANFDHLGIAIDQDKFTIAIEQDTCRTSIPNIYACGGVVVSCWSWVDRFVHEQLDSHESVYVVYICSLSQVPCAVQQGYCAANAIANYRQDDSVHMNQLTNTNGPFVINVIPAVASVGNVPRTVDDALVYIFEFQYNRRAIIDNQIWGFIKMWITRDEPKRFLAVQLVHEAAAEIIEYYSMIIRLSKSNRSN
jgi:pyruvate/2-oxoglutarate dehydrogenase complex dihydrolipoamide dehydrogenase (E3) component